MVISGVQRFQLIQTEMKALNIRLELMSNANVAQVAQIAVGHLREYLNSQSLSSVELKRSVGPPFLHS
jgi:hypothetical protein